MTETIDVDVVCGNLSDLSELDRLRDRLSDDERQRVDRYKVRTEMWTQPGDKIRVRHHDHVFALSNTSI